MIFKSNKGKYLTKEEAIDIMVSLSATETNSNRSREVSITLYLRENYRVSGVSTGNLKKI